MKEPWLWQESDVLSLITNRVRESLILEYKSCDALARADAKKREISKDVSALANSAGGVIVYGVMEDRGTHEPKDVDIGYDPTDLSAEWLEQVINSNVQRRITGVRINTVDLISTRPGKVLYVVYVPESNLAPHMAADKRFYKRFETQAVAMEEYEVRNLMRQEHYPSHAIVEAWRDVVINPLLGMLASEHAYLERKKWTWDVYGRELQELHHVGEHSGFSGNHEEFLAEYPDLQAVLDDHDAAVDEVYLRCKTLFQEIRRSSYLLDIYLKTTTSAALQEVKAAYAQRLGQYETDEALLQALFGQTTSRDEHLALLAQYIVNGTGDLPHNYTTHPFWNTHKDKFLVLPEYPPLSEYRVAADRARQQLLARGGTLIKMMKQIRSELSRQHGIPVEAVVRVKW